MKHITTILLFLSITIASLAQTQQGFVKTRGRMVNGQHVRGQGLQGAMVVVQGGNKVVTQNSNGAFSIAVPSKTFLVQSVQKKGYTLVDADATKKPYQLSSNPLYLVMETPEQQTQDRLDAERKLRRTLQRQLQEREDEIEAMQVSLAEKQRMLQQLYDDQKNNEKLIADMAKEYAQMDYDQMDALNQRISDAILNGRLTEADSLLRSKGDMQSRIARIRQEQQAEAQREAEIAREQAELAASKEGTKRRLDDAASDCYKFFDRFKLVNQHDSAAYYIELRAELDTTNAKWQFDAAKFLQEQKQYGKSASYCERSLRLCRLLAQSNPQACEPNLASTLNNLAILYKNTQRFTESESLYKEALEIYRRMAHSNPQAFEPDLASTLYNLANLYYKTQRFAESESLYKEALEIRRRLAHSNPQAYEPDMAQTLNNLAILYLDIQRFAESELLYKEALEIYRRLAQSNPQAYEPDLASILNNLAGLYYNTKRLAESESLYKEALEIRRRLAQSNPQTYEPDVANTQFNLGLLKLQLKQYSDAISYFERSLDVSRIAAKVNPALQNNYEESLYWLSLLYSETKNHPAAYAINQELLPIMKGMYEENPDDYKSDYTSRLGSQSFNAIFMKQYQEAERCAREALAIDSTQHWIQGNLAAALLFQGKYGEAEAIYCQYKSELKDSFLDDLKQFAEAGVIPKEREADVEKIKKLLEE